MTGYRTYAGVGSRSAPADILQRAQMLAEHLADRGWVLRSGHAPGMDQAFEAGAYRHAEVYLPWPSFEHGEPLEADVIVDRPTSAAYNIAQRYHPVWDSLHKAGRAFHARNTHQVLGRDCSDPCAFVICWTPGGEKLGGTAQAMRVAEGYGVPVFNLARADHLARIDTLLTTDWEAA